MEGIYIYIPNHLLLQIFSCMDPVKLMKLRLVNSDWKAFIENECKIWRQLVCSSTEVKPWRYQLIKLKYPSMSCDSYDQLDADEFKELFISFIEWRKVYKSDHCQINCKIPEVQFLNWESGNDAVIDSVDKYIAIASLSEPVRIFLIDVDSNESIENPLELTSYFNEIIFNDISDVFHIKIWRPVPHKKYIFITAENKLILIIKSNDEVLIFDLNEKIFMRTPELLEYYNECDTIICRGSNDIYFGFENFGTSQLVFVKCQYDAINRKINNELLLYIDDYLAQRITERFFRFEDMVVINKVMIIAYQVRAHMRVTVIDFSEVDKFPLTIDVSDKAYTRKIFGKIDMFYISELLTGVAKNFFLDEFSRLKLLETKAAYPDGVTEITIIKFHLNNLYLITKKGQLLIYKLKNFEHLKYLDFDRLTPKVIDLKSRGSVKDIFFLELREKPIIVIARKYSPIILLYFH
ncbi:hypothetical protein KQX54_019158 [Cotesia glomerata]|uniref:F-box domain-containing protein n=1 Tax=Cotesia glomerata TaxID=32391 RepID=A0AAV7IS36_COTGL|nr:hypothetical protein KQX54_019158 [Cotesia glomerata]